MTSVLTPRQKKEVTGTGIPLIGTIAAGRPVEAIENLVEELAISPDLFDCRHCFVLRVKGDSMIGAQIMDGDLAIIRLQQRVENGETAAVTVDVKLSEATLKIVYRDRYSLSLVPANSAHSSLVFKGPQCQWVSIIGILVGVIRRS